MIFHYDSFPTSFGPFSIAANPAGALIATAFGDLEALRSRLAGASGSELVRDRRLLATAREQVLSYVRGDRQDFDLPRAPTGTEFQTQVWDLLGQIPYGETRSYLDLARRLATSARAVGRANATNPICLIIPCHRVIGTDGSLTGFAFGEDLKARLLDHEHRSAPRSNPVTAFAARA